MSPPSHRRARLVLEPPILRAPPAIRAWPAARRRGVRRQGIALVVAAAHEAALPASSPIDAPGRWGAALAGGVALAFAGYVCGIVALRRRAVPVARGDRGRRRRPAHTARRPDPALHGHVDVLDVRPRRRRGGRQSLRRSSEHVPGGRRLRGDGKLVARHDLALRPAVHDRLRAARARRGRGSRARGLALPARRRTRGARHRRARGVARRPPRLRRGVRGLEPPARAPLRRRRPQRRGDDAPRRRRARARRSRAAEPRGSRLDRGDRPEVGRRRLPRPLGDRPGAPARAARPRRPRGGGCRASSQAPPRATAPRGSRRSAASRARRGGPARSGSRSGSATWASATGRSS